MSGQGNYLTQLRRSHASGIHGKNSADRNNRTRQAIDQELTDQGGHMSQSMFTEDEDREILRQDDYQDDEYPYELNLVDWSRFTWDD